VNLGDREPGAFGGARVIGVGPVVVVQDDVDAPDQQLDGLSATEGLVVLAKSAPSPSTPTAATTAPANHQVDPKDPENHNGRTQHEGSPVRDVPRHHTVELGGIEPPSISR
jgi:hypothetical protein